MLTRIIVPTCDRPDALNECILSIVAHTDSQQTPYEIVIVDSGKTGLHPLANKYIRVPPALGFSRAVNAGAQASEADYIVWLNDDALAEPGWLSTMLSYMAKNEKVGIGCFYFSDLRWPGTGHHVFFYRDEVYPNFGCVRRSVWEKLGGFNPAFFSYGAETDIGHRCRDHGYHVEAVRGARVHHKYIRDTFRVNHVKKIAEQDYQALRVATYGPESDDNMHWMDESGKFETHRQYNTRNQK